MDDGLYSSSSEIFGRVDCWAFVEYLWTFFEYLWAFFEDGGSVGIGDVVYSSSSEDGTNSSGSELSTWSSPDISTVPFFEDGRSVC